MSKNEEYEREISAEIREKWQNILDILVKIAGSSDAWITRLDYPFLEVFKESNNVENDFREGKKVKLSGHYCEKVIKNDKKLMVENALENEEWKDSLEVEEGFNAYLGYPLKWPDNKIFGTLCIHDKKTHDFPEQTQKIMLEFKELIESHLKIINNNFKVKRYNEIIKKQKNKLNWIIEGTDAGTWEWNIQTGEAVFDNKWAEILGYSLKELSPTNIETWKKYTHPEDLKKAEKELKKHFNRETENYDVEIRMKHKEGHWVWVNDRGRITSWTEDNQPLKMFGVHLNITDRKKQEEKIKLLNQKLKNEINKTAKVHENNFLGLVPKYKDISLATYYSPTERVGGDFYNFIELDNKLLFYLSDITGHNLEGIVFNSFIKETISNYVELVEKPIKIDKLMKHLHRQYLKNNFPDDYFICLFIGCLDLDSLELEYISQGFQFPPLLNSNHNSKDHLEVSGMPISSAIPEGMINYEINSYDLKNKDSIIFYTDGIAEQKQHKMYYERFKETFYKYNHLSAEEIKHKIMTDFKEFNNGSLRGNDDITFFIMKINN